MELIISSNLQQGNTVCPGDVVNFSCTTRGSSFLAWTSDPYIGPDNVQLKFEFSDVIGTFKASNISNTTQAILTNVTEEDRELVLKSNLSITVLPSIDLQGHSVACLNTDVGVRNITTFSRGSKYIIMPIL